MTAKLTAPGRPDLSAEWDLDRELAEFDAKQTAKTDAIRAIVDAGQAVRGGGALAELVIVSREMGPERGYRASFLRDDGPSGHVTRATLDAVINEITQLVMPPYTAASDAEVMRWTTTKRYEVGSRQVAYVQAENMLRYRMGSAPQAIQDVIVKAISTAQDILHGHSDSIPELERATQILGAALAKVPVANPKRSSPLMRNPAWVTGAIADSYDTIARQAEADWMPLLAGVDASRGTLLAKLTEFGCGAYGCVVATHDKATVIKVTSDPSEATFAVQWSASCVEFCCDYRMVVKLNAKHDGRPINLLWRESAEHVGELLKVVPKSRAERVRVALHAQHRAGQVMYTAVLDGERKARAAISRWLKAVVAMTEVPELGRLATGLLGAFKQHGLIFGDLHEGNLGLITRDGKLEWIITDPGHVTAVRLD